MLLMGLGSMASLGGEAGALVAAGMEGDPAVLGKDLHHPYTESDFDGLMDQQVGDAAVVPVHLDRVVDTDLGLAPVAQLIGMEGQGLEGRLIALLEEQAAAAGQFLERGVIELL